MFKDEGQEIEYLPTSMYNKTKKEERYEAICMGVFLLIVICLVWFSI